MFTCAIGAEFSFVLTVPAIVEPGEHVGIGAGGAGAGAGGGGLGGGTGPGGDGGGTGPGGAGAGDGGAGGGGAGGAGGLGGLGGLGGGGLGGGAGGVPAQFGFMIGIQARSLHAPFLAPGQGDQPVCWQTQWVHESSGGHIAGLDGNRHPFGQALPAPQHTSLSQKTTANAGDANKKSISPMNFKHPSAITN